MKSALPPLKEMVSSLIGTPSVSSTQAAFDQSNEQVIHLLANWLEPLGFDVRITPVKSRAGKFNLVARLGQGDAGLLFSGHSDTVPFDEHLWHSNPFAMTERDERWYGLGSCDMKSYFAIVLDTLRPLFDESLAQKLEQPLIIMATADEESSMFGARELQAADVAGARFALIGEPTDMKPVTRHKGIVFLNLRIDGTSGHSSDPELGNNAIEGMHLAIDELMRFRAELKVREQDPGFAINYPTMNFGCIHGGDNPNRICDHAELAFDLRNLPSMDMTGFCESLEARIRSKVAGDGFSCRLEMLFPPVPAFTNPDSALAGAIEANTGLKPGAVAFGTEAQFLGNLSLDTVVMGPGSINQAHQPDEYLALDQIAPAQRVIHQLVQDFCLNQR